MRLLTVIISLSFLVLASCSDDDKPPTDGGTTVGDAVGGDVTSTDDATTTDAPATDAKAADGPVGGDDSALPWPDMTVKQDSTPDPCTPEEPGMCADDKNLYCAGGTCTDCPYGSLDCDRKGDCECPGACNGKNCVQ